MDKSWIYRSRFSKIYKEGVKSFLHIAKNHLNAENKTRCPCRDCQNSRYHNLVSIQRHLFKNGMAFSYKNWIYHGEQPNIDCPSPRAQTYPTVESVEEDDMMGLLDDAFGPTLMDTVSEQPGSSASQPQITAPSNEPTVQKLGGHSTDGVSRWTKRDRSTVSAPQPQITVSNSIRTSSNGASCEKKSSPFTDSVQHRTNLSSDEPMVPNSIRTSFKASKPFKKVHLLKVMSGDGDEFEDDEWMENTLPKRLRGPIEVFHKTHYNDTKGWTSKLAEAHYNEMIALQKEQEGSDEAKCLSEKEICAIVLEKQSACVFSFKSKTRAEELEAENKQLKLELQEMKAIMAGVKDMQKMINQLQDFQKRIEGDSPSTTTDVCMD